MIYTCTPVKAAAYYTGTFSVNNRLYVHNYKTLTIDREFEFYNFFSFLKFNEFYDFFSGEKNSQKFRNFVNHRCLTYFDVVECNIHL